MKKSMITIAKTRYLLVDHSKFEANALMVFGRLEDIEEVITDEDVDMSVLTRIQHLGVRGTTASNVKLTRWS